MCGKLYSQIAQIRRNNQSQLFVAIKTAICTTKSQPEFGRQVYFIVELKKVQTVVQFAFFNNLT